MTTDWTSGYVADIGYTFGYYNELNPLRAKLALLNAGIAPPENNGLNACHCELGFGQGMSANIHAAASATTWYGNDFNPTQTSFAQSVARASGAKAFLTDQSFEEFCTRQDLPEFDSIGLHGIWSWISDHNRALIVDFIRRKLKVGGVLYISYNTLPGWSSFAPVRHLMTQHSMVMGSDGAGIVNRVNSALAFAEKLVQTASVFTQTNPQVESRLEKLKDQDRHYLAHEYFNKDWAPMYFSDMTRWLESAKMNFGCSAYYLDHVDTVNLTVEQQTLLKDTSNPMFKETVRDYLVNQQFRRDYWIKGARQLTILEKMEALKATEVILHAVAQDVPMKVRGSLGEADLTPSIYKPILQLLSDLKPHPIGEIEKCLASEGLSLANLIQAIVVLVGGGYLSEVQSHEHQIAAANQCIKLNKHLMYLARGSNDINFLASPVTGGGVVVSRFHKLFLLAILEGHQSPNAWAQFVWEILQIQGQRLVKEGKSIETPEENLTWLTSNAIEFEQKRLPIIKSLKII